jgi:hypothetical protein
MNKSNLPGLSPLWLISLAMVLGTPIVVLLPVAIGTGDSIKSSDWIGFAGSVVAGAITLLAAILAWFAVQRQIRALEDAEKRATERAAEQRTTEMAHAKEAAKIVLTHTVHAAAAAMNLTVQYIEAAAAEPFVPGLAKEYGDLDASYRVQHLRKSAAPSVPSIGYQSTRHPLQLFDLPQGFDGELADVFDRDSKV